MLKLPTTERGRSWSPQRKRHGWIALWLQERRRRRVAAASAPGPGAVLLQDLAGYFALEETSGNRVDLVNGYVLAPVSTVGSGTGLIGTALETNGSGYLVGNQSTSLFSPSASGFTVSTWVNCADIPNPYSEASLVSVWQDSGWPSGSSWHIYSTTPSTGSVRAQVLGSGWAYLYGSADLDQWTHICLVYEPVAGEWTLYVNAVAAQTVSFDYAAVAGKLAVSSNTNPIIPYAQGLFDELAVWTRALSAEEVELLNNNGLGLGYPFDS